MTDTNEKICFVIAPIGKPESDTRKRSDQVLQHIIRPAVESCGYKAVRADKIADPGIITSQIIRHIVDDPLVVADLTEQNANVFYELAIRHAIRKPLIQIIDKVEAIPFDLITMRTIQVDHQNLDSVEEAKTEIRRQIQFLEENPSSLENPISVSLADRSGSNPLDEIMTQAQDYLEEIERNRDKSYEIIQGMNAESADDDPTKAKQIVEDIRENPQASSTDKAIAEAVSLQEQGDVEEAIKIWRGIADAFEDADRELAGRAHFSVGYLLYLQEKFEDAIASYDQAVRLKPDYVDAYNNRGNLRDDLGQRSAAIVDFDEAIRLNPDYADAYFNRGITKYHMERCADAVVDFDQAIRLKPDYIKAYLNRGIVKDLLGRHEVALADFDEAIRLNPDYADAYNSRGIAKDQLGHHEAAIVDFDEAIRLNPDYADAYNSRGITKYHMERYADAIVDFDEAIRLKPGYIEAHLNRGIMKDLLGRHEVALADFDEAIRLKSDYADAYNSRGIAKSSLGRIDEARQDFEKAHDLAHKAGNDSLVALVEQGLRKNSTAKKCNLGLCRKAHRSDWPAASG